MQTLDKPVDSLSTTIRGVALVAILLDLAKSMRHDHTLRPEVQQVVADS